MTTWIPISGVVPQSTKDGNQANGMVRKFYEVGTVTPLAVSTNGTGSPTTTEFLLDTQGYTTLSSIIVIPHVSSEYKEVLYLNQVDADADDTGSAVYEIDNISLGNVFRPFFSDFDNLAAAIADVDGIAVLGTFIRTGEYIAGSGIGGGTYEVVSVNPLFNLINPAKTDGSGNFLKLVSFDVITPALAGCSFDGTTNYAANFADLFDFSAANNYTIDGQHQTYQINSTIDVSNTSVINMNVIGVSTVDCFRVEVEDASFYCNKLTISTAKRALSSIIGLEDMTNLKLIDYSADGVRLGAFFQNSFVSVEVRGGVISNVGGADLTADPVIGLQFGNFAGGAAEADFRIAKDLIVTDVTMTDVIYTGTLTNNEVHGIICYGENLIITDNIINNVTRANMPDNENDAGCEGIYTKALRSTIISNNIVVDAGLRDAAITMKRPSATVAYPEDYYIITDNKIKFVADESRQCGGIISFAPAIISGNTVEGGTYYAIRVSGELANRSTIKDNTILNHKYFSAIRVAGDDIVIRDNDLINPIGDVNGLITDLDFITLEPASTLGACTVLRNTYTVGTQLDSGIRPRLIEFDYTSGKYNRLVIDQNTLIDQQFPSTDNGNVGVFATNHTTGIVEVLGNNFDCTINGRLILGAVENEVKTDFSFYTAIPTSNNAYWNEGDIAYNNNVDVAVSNGWVNRTSAGQWVELPPLEPNFSANDAVLNDISQAVNTTGKFAGRLVFNSSRGYIVFASGAAAGDTWKAIWQENAVVNTPV
jgi:hypothetical protein